MGGSSRAEEIANTQSPEGAKPPRQITCEYSGSRAKAFWWDLTKTKAEKARLLKAARKRET